jgi:hypothetical protein
VAAPAACVAPQLACWPSCWRARRPCCTGGAAPATRAPASGARLLQIAAGSRTCSPATASARAAGVRSGTAIVALAAFAAFGAARARRAGRGAVRVLRVAARRCLAAGWAVGARYFYLPAVGLAWAVAEALAGAGGRRAPTIAAVLLLSAAAGGQRRADVVSYDRRVAAARRVVAAGAAAGHRVFHIMSGVKDLDLAVKEDRALAAAAGECWC